MTSVGLFGGSLPYGIYALLEMICLTHRVPQALTYMVQWRTSLGTRSFYYGSTPNENDRVCERDWD